MQEKIIHMQLMPNLNNQIHRPIYSAGETIGRINKYDKTTGKAIGQIFYYSDAEGKEILDALEKQNIDTVSFLAANDNKKRLKEEYFSKEENFLNMEIKDNSGRAVCCRGIYQEDGTIILTQKEYSLAFNQFIGKYYCQWNLEVVSTGTLYFIKPRKIAPDTDKKEPVAEFIKKYRFMMPCPSCRKPVYFLDRMPFNGKRFEKLNIITGKGISEIASLHVKCEFCEYADYGLLDVSRIVEVVIPEILEDK